MLPQTDAEFREQQLTYVKNSGNYTKVFEASFDSSSYPESVDWRTKNAVTSIKNQVHYELQHNPCVATESNIFYMGQKDLGIKLANSVALSIAYVEPPIT